MEPTSKYVYLTFLKCALYWLKIWCSAQQEQVQRTHPAKVTTLKFVIPVPGDVRPSTLLSTQGIYTHTLKAKHSFI